ncbi:hypothetical protein ACS0TY_013553 [Phlomoides rotata]
MGGCLSSESFQKPSAYVVSVNGELRQFPLPITVSQVLDESSSDSDSDSDSFFLCNSDALYFDDYIPCLQSDDELVPCQVYFVLPIAKLHYRLAASDMAALAVKASVALHQIRGRKNRTRISPVLVSEEDPQSNHTVNYTKNKTPRSASVRKKKLTTYSSQRAKLAVNMKLTTIYEGSVLHPTF